MAGFPDCHHQLPRQCLVVTAYTRLMPHGGRELAGTPDLAGTGEPRKQTTYPSAARYPPVPGLLHHVLAAMYLKKRRYLDGQVRLGRFRRYLATAAQTKLQ